MNQINEKIKELTSLRKRLEYTSQIQRVFQYKVSNMHNSDI
ncbi:MAG: hypothetical protein RL023_518 [Candidatus Parcubacteria bacterium]